MFGFRDMGCYGVLLGWGRFDDMGHIPSGRGVGQYMGVIDFTLLS